MTFGIVNKPAWLYFRAATGRLQGTPAAADIGTYSNIVIRASDGVASTPLQAFSITVIAPPTITGTPSTAATAGTQYSFTPTANAANGGALRFAITNRPAWATFTAATGRLQGTPVTASAGTYSNIVIRVKEGIATAALPAFSIAVIALPNEAPTISGTPSTSTIQGKWYGFQPTASDIDGDALTFSIVNKPAWLYFQAATGRLQGTPKAANVGTSSGIVISVSDSKVSTPLPAFAIVVAAPRTPRRPSAALRRPRSRKTRCTRFRPQPAMPTPMC